MSVHCISFHTTKQYVSCFKLVYAFKSLNSTLLYLLRASTVKLGPSSPGRVCTVVITHLYPVNSPQLLRELGNMAFKGLIIKILFITQRDRLASSSSILLPPKKTEGKWAQKIFIGNLFQLLNTDHLVKLPFIQTEDLQTWTESLESTLCCSGQGRLIFLQIS